MCNCLFCHNLHTEEIRLSNISDSLLSGSSSQKVWNSSNSDTEDKDNIYTYDTNSSELDMLESLSYSVCKLWHKRQLHINTDFAVTGWMLCVIPHISKDAKDHLYSDNRKQDNNVINTLFSGASEEEMAVTLDLFWTEYNDYYLNDLLHLCECVE